MSTSTTWQDVAAFSAAWGGATASAWSEGATRYTQEAARVLQQSGQQILTETQKFEIFATEQARSFRNLADTAKRWADAAADAGNTGIADIMRKYGDKAAASANDVLSGAIDKKQWLDALVKDANIQIDAANKTIGKVGGGVGKAFGPIVDAAQMITGAVEYVQTGDKTNWENACAGVAASAAAAALVVILAPASAGIVIVALAAGAAAGAASYFGGKYFQDLNTWLQSQNWFIDTFDKVIGPLVDTLFRDALNWVPPRRDPLVLGKLCKTPHEMC
jgi:hypothetical protein